MKNQPLKCWLFEPNPMGLKLNLLEPLKEGDGWKAEDYLVRQWYYLPTENYGGPKLDLKDLKILSVNVSDDRKKVFLELDGMKENHVVYVKLQTAFISTNNNELWSTEAWYTMNKIPENPARYQNGCSCSDTS